MTELAHRRACDAVDLAQSFVASVVCRRHRQGGLEAVLAVVAAYRGEPTCTPFADRSRATLRPFFAVAIQNCEAALAEERKRQATKERCGDTTPRKRAVSPCASDDTLDDEVSVFDNLSDLRSGATATP
jgi:hypothetical protein